MRTRFLIVDDSELVRQGLRTVLQANPDWEIAGEAADGMTAVEVFKDVRPNVVIVDFQMPGINGIETARRLLEIAPAVPVVMFTQHASADLEKHAREAGIRSVVSKTDAFPMVGIIEALLGSDESSTGGAEEGGRDGHSGHAKPEKI
ncbi:MAG: response regulator transcription factor [Candidatus Acidiferrales bacterium]